ncbi:30S ribosomal protein S27ae [Candidatus Woesearchaeota archaeon B3_Woes]|nr:MAG: 30S ribosomal protein S27ae [Candidatus Woesearchaeota archaeon B3_Woes]
MADKKEGKEVKKKKTSKRYENYEVSGNSVKRKNKSCPKCGMGVFLANHKDRLYCGKCGYVEMKSSEDKK